MKVSFFFVPAFAAALSVNGVAHAQENAMQVAAAAWRSEALRAWASVEKFELVYDAEPGPRIKQGLPLHKVLAAAADDFHHFSAHPSEKMSWQYDPFAQVLVIHEGIISYYRPNVRTVLQNTIKRGEVLPGSAYRDIIFAILPSWPLQEYSLPKDDHSGAPVSLRTLAEAPDFKLLDVVTENGESSYLYGYKGRVKLWFPVDKPLCLSRREIVDPASGKILERILVAQRREIGPGLWLPTTFTVESFNDRDQLIKEATFHIRDVRLNALVDRSLFNPQFAAGTIQVKQERKDKKYVQLRPGGRDILDQYITFMRQYANLPRPALGRKEYINSILCALTGLGVGLSSALLLRHRWRRPDRSS